MAKNPYMNRRSRSNPVGANSYIDDAFTSKDAKMLRGLEDMPSSVGYRRGEVGLDDRRRGVVDPDALATAAKPARDLYANRIFRVQNLNDSYFPKADPPLAPKRLKGGLAAYLDGWTPEDEKLEGAQTVYSGVFRLTPRKGEMAEKGGTTVDYWSGGFEALKSIGSNWLSDPAGRNYAFENLAPWTPDNPQGTGVWRDIGTLILTGSVRGDEAFAATHFLKQVMSPSLRAYTRNALSRKDLETNLQQGFHNILAAIYGNWNKEIVDAAHLRGVQRVQMQMAHAESQSALRAAAGSGRGTTQVRAIGAAGRMAERSQNQLRPPVSQAPAAVERAMETAAAAITAPVTPSHPVEAKIRVLRRMGVNERISARILATSSVAEQMEFIDDVMAGWSN